MTESRKRDRPERLEEPRGEAAHSSAAGRRQAGGAERTTESAAEENATLGALVAGIAHELNTPLGAIHANHDIIKRALLKLRDILADEVVTPDELVEVRRVVRAMRTVLRTNGVAVERMVGLVRNLRNFGKPNPAEIRAVDLHEELDGTLALLSSPLQGVGVTRDYGDMPPVVCHPLSINQVFVNLVHNAAQSMPRGGSLTLATRREGDSARIRIADTGKGIRADLLARIFEPGFTTKGGRVGMGLGLAISRQIIDHHKGDISVESELGRGSTFTVSLPL